MRRTSFFIGVAIACLFGGSVAVIHWLTGDAPRAAAEEEARVAVREPGPLAPAPAPAPGAEAAPPGAGAPPQPELAAAPAPGQPQRAVSAPGYRPVPGAPRIDLSFKLDPRLTRGLHMGERWVSPRTYTTAGDAKSVSVHARARVLDGGGRPSSAAPTWSASEPDMVDVSRDEGEQVQITVWRAGESSLTVSSGGASRTLVVRAEQAGGVMRVNIAQ